MLLGLLRSRPDPIRAGAIAQTRTRGQLTESGTDGTAGRTESGTRRNGLADVACAERRRQGRSAGCLTPYWRRGRDSNPRCRCRHTRFPSVLLKPLGHLSWILLAAACANHRGARGEVGGEAGIRTLDTLADMLVFETSPFGHSGTSP